MSHVGIPRGAGTVEVAISNAGPEGPFLFSAGKRCYAGSPCTGLLKMRAIPRDDYSFSHWEVRDDPYPESPFRYMSLLTYDFTAPVFAWAVLDKKPELKFLISRSETSAAAPIPCIGYCTANPARKYYQKDINSFPNWREELINVQAHAQPGWNFVKWREQSGGWASLNQEETIIRYLDDDTYPVTNSSIWIRLEDSQGPKTRTLEAIFCDCQHLGMPDNGCLQGDISIASNLGRVLLAPGTNYFGCDYYIHAKLRQAAQTWWNFAVELYYPVPHLTITRISREHGGDPQVPGGHSHWNGLDVDVRYIRSDHQDIPYNFADGISLYDQNATQSLVNFLRESGNVSVIYADEWSRDGLTGVTHRDPYQYPNVHNNHFHVRFADPDGEENQCP